MGMYAAFGAVGLAMQVMGKIADANSEAGQLKAQSAFERRNAALLDERALQVGAEGARNEEQVRREFRQYAGSQMAAAGEGGFDATGSATDILRQAEKLGELDAQNVRYRAATEARGYRIEAGNARTRSVIASKMAKRAKISGYLKAAGTAASGFAGGFGGAAGGGGSGLMAMNYAGGISRGMA